MTVLRPQLSTVSYLQIESPFNNRYKSPNHLSSLFVNVKYFLPNLKLRNDAQITNVLFNRKLKQIIVVKRQNNGKGTQCKTRLSRKKVK